MKTVATLTSKGQITIPRVVRRALGLKTGDRLEFELESGQVGLRAVKPALTSAGVLRAQLPKNWKSTTPAEMDHAMARHLALKHHGA